MTHPVKNISVKYKYNYQNKKIATPLTSTGRPPVKE
jgi:hypothetical protein